MRATATLTQTDGGSGVAAASIKLTTSARNSVSASCPALDLHSSPTRRSSDLVTGGSPYTSTAGNEFTWTTASSSPTEDVTVSDDAGNTSTATTLTFSAD